MMRGTRPMVVAHIHYAGEPVHQLKLRQSSLCCRAPLTPEMKAVLDQDRRQRGEHRPKRLVLGRCLRDPYFFFCAKLPHGGLHLPHHDLAALAVDVDVLSPQPLFDHAFLLHLKGSEPRIHPSASTSAGWPIANGAWRSNGPASPTTGKKAPAAAACRCASASRRSAPCLRCRWVKAGHAVFGVQAVQGVPALEAGEAIGFWCISALGLSAHCGSGGVIVSLYKAIFFCVRDQTPAVIAWRCEAISSCVRDQAPGVIARLCEAISSWRPRLNLLITCTNTRSLRPKAGSR